MFGAEIIILDPEHEYEKLAISVGGEYINFTFSSEAKINPFDLSAIYEEGENELGQKIISLHGLLKIMLGDMTAQQEALLDRALVATYKAKGITPDPATQNNQPPLMEDLYKALIGFESDGTNDLAMRLEKFITGSFRGIFDHASNVDITNQFTVFSVKEMEEELRPIAMYIILDFIWTRVKKTLKKRILVIDEAWYFMKHQDSASFIHTMAKRARKYYLGITTITQDVEDFLNNEYGKAIVSNSSIQFLMKQSTVSIPALTQAFYLSEGERQLLMAADVGEGIFFAGQNHVALRVVASQDEHVVITTDPEELLQEKSQSKKSVIAKPRFPREESILSKNAPTKKAEEKTQEKPEDYYSERENKPQVGKNQVRNDVRVEKNNDVLVKKNQVQDGSLVVNNQIQNKLQIENKPKTIKKSQRVRYTIDQYTPPEVFGNKD